MSDVLEIHELTFDGPDLLVVEALVDQMVITRSQSQLEPEEWGPAVCRGSMHFCVEDLMPPTDTELRKMLSDRVDDWALVDQSDFYE